MAASSAAIPSPIATSCDACKQSFISSRTKACDKAVCKAYALANVSAACGYPGSIHPEITEWIQETKPVQGPIKSVAPIAAGGGGGGKKAKTAIEYLTPEAAVAALQVLNTELTGPAYSDRVKSAYIDSLTMEGFKKNLLDSLTDPETKTKKFLDGSIREDLAEKTVFNSLVGNAWASFGATPGIVSLRIASAFEKAEASLQLLDAKLAAGEVPDAALLFGSGPTLLGRFDPFGIIKDEARTKAINDRWEQIKTQSNILETNWAKNGKAVLSAVSTAFEGFIQREQNLLEAAGRNDTAKSAAGERVTAYFNGEDFAPTGTVVTILTAKGVLPDTAKLAVANFAAVRAGVTQLDGAIRTKLVNAYNTAAIKRLTAAKELLKPVVNARIEHLAKVEDAITYDNVKAVIDQFAATDAGASIRGMLLGDRETIFINLRKEYGKAHPEATKLFKKAAKLEWDKKNLKVAIKAIVDDLLTTKLDVLEKMSKKDIRAALRSENNYVIAEANGVPSESYQRRVIQDRERLNGIVKKIRESIAAKSKELKAVQVPPDQVATVRATKRKQDVMSLEQRREQQRKQKEERLKQRIKEVQEFRREVAQVWKSSIPSDAPDPISALRSLPADQRSSTADDILSAYETVSKGGQTFSDFVRLCKLSEETASGSMAHRLAWDVLDNSPQGRARRTLLVDNALKEVTLEQVTSEFFVNGLPWKQHERLANSTTVKTKKWKSTEERTEYIVQRLVRNVINRLAEEAPSELNDKDASMRMMDGSLDTDEAPRGLLNGVRDIVQRSEALIQAIKESPGDVVAFQDREAGLRELKELSKHADALKSDILIDAYDTTDLESDKGIILARFAELTATKQSFLEATFSKWRVPPFRKDDPKRPKAAGGRDYATTFPPYLLQAPIGQRIMTQYADLYDQLKVALSGPSKKAPSEESVQNALQHKRDDEASRAAASVSPTSPKLGDPEDSEEGDEDYDPKKGSESGGEEEGAEEASEDGDDPASESIPAAADGSPTRFTRGTKFGNSVKGGGYLKDDWIIEDGDPDYQAWMEPQKDDVKMGEPSDAAFFRNNPGAVYGSTTIGFGGGAAAVTTKPAPQLPVTVVNPPPETPVPEPAAVVNVLMPRKRLNISGRDMSSPVGGTEDPFGPAVTSDAPVMGTNNIPPAIATFEVVTEDGWTL